MIDLQYCPRCGGREPAPAKLPRQGLRPRCIVVAFGDGENRGRCPEPPEWDVAVQDGDFAAVRAVGGAFCQAHAEERARHLALLP